MNRFPGFDMHLRLNGIGTASQGSGLTVETPKGREVVVVGKRRGH